MKEELKLLKIAFRYQFDGMNVRVCELRIISGHFLLLVWKEIEFRLENEELKRLEGHQRAGFISW